MILDVWNASTGVGVIKSNQTGVKCWLNALISNNTGGPITLNLGIAKNTSNPKQYVKVCPKDLILAAGESFEVTKIGFPPAWEFQITTTGSIDYFVSLYDE